MNFLEFLWRFKISVRKKTWKVFPPKYRQAINYELAETEPQLNSDISFNDQTNAIISEANAYLKHQWLFFGLTDCFENQIDWHKDPMSNISAPTIFGFDINHRDENLVGNVKMIWEKNRHHHLTILAEAFYLTNNEIYAEEVKKQLESWIDQNPYLIGVNWTHPLEQGIRLISWVYVHKFLKKSDCFEDIFGKEGFIWKSVYEHQKFISITYSRGSSANNHLIGEMAGLYIASVTWPVFKESKGWKKLSLKILEKELVAQNFNDGINRELGFSYQLFVAQFALLCMEAENSFSEEYKRTLHKMIKFISEIERIMGSLPNYGDGDEGMALQLNPIESKQIEWLTNYARKHLKVEKLSSSRNDQSLVSREAGLVAFSRITKGNRVSVLFDCGPLGMGSMAAHGHADALSFTMNINSYQVFVDPGTYCYHDDLEWRAYFRGTKAHNTVNVDDKDQSVQAGPFLWSKKAQCKIENVKPNEFYVSASHNGYADFKINHKRSLEFDENCLSIEDIVDGLSKHKIEMRFHLYPDINLKIVPDGVIIFNDFVQILMRFDKQLSLSILEGQNLGGWYSPKFGIKVKSKTIVLSQTLSLPAKFKTKIEIQ